MFKIIRKSDIVLFFVLLAIGIALSIPGFMSGKSSSGVVEISVEGKPYGIYDLSQNTEIPIQQGDHLNKVIIKDGAVQITEATCHNKDCVKQGTISKVNQSIICLPNRVVVRIAPGSSESSEGGGVDVISG